MQRGKGAGGIAIAEHPAGSERANDFAQFGDGRFAAGTERRNPFPKEQAPKISKIDKAGREPPEPAMRN